MKKKVPFVSVVVPVKNQEKTIGKSIDSLLNLDYSKYEIIIVDNNSIDNSPNIIQEYKNKKIKLLLEQKPGAYNARNKGIQTAKGEIIAFTDGDCIVDKNWLKFLVQPFKDKRIGGVGGKIKAYKPKTKFELYCNKFHHSNEKHIKNKKPFILTSNASYRKRILKKIGLFDGSLHSGGDVDVSWKTTNLGYKLHFEPKAIVSHIYEETLPDMFRKSFWRGKYRALVEIKHKIPNKKMKIMRHVYSLVYMIREYPLNWVFYHKAIRSAFDLGVFYNQIIWKTKKLKYNLQKFLL